MLMFHKKKNAIIFKGKFQSMICLCTKRKVNLIWHITHCLKCFFFLGKIVAKALT